MKNKLIILSLGLLLLAGLTAAGPDVSELSVDKNISTVAGNTDTSVLTFRYNGDVAGRTLDPLAIGVEIGDGNITHEMFDISGSLESDGNTYSLRCGGEYSDVVGDWEVSEYYGNAIPSENPSNQWYCFTENRYLVLPAIANIESKLNMNITPHYAMAPKTYEINYTFHSFEGTPDFDPRGQTDENGSLVFDEIGLEIESEPGANFSVVTYSDIFFDSKMPANEEELLFYTRINTLDDENYSINLNYSQQKIEQENLQDPTLYRCLVVDDDCVWIDVPEQSSGDGTVEASLEYSSLYGLFTSQETQQDSTTDSNPSGGSGGGGGSVSTSGSIDVSDDSEINQSGQNQSETINSTQQDEPEEIPNQVELDVDEQSEPGEPVEVTALVDGQPTEGVEVFLDGQQQGVTDDSGTLTFTPQEEGNLTVAAAYNNSFNSSDIQIVSSGNSSNQVTGQAFGSVPSYGFIILIALMVGLVYWRRENLVSYIKDLTAKTS